MSLRSLVWIAVSAVVATAVVAAQTAAHGSVLADDSPPTHRTVLVPVAELGARASAVELHGSVMFVALNARLATLDVTDPIAPSLLAAGPELPGDVNGMVTDGSYVFVALGDQGVAIYDVRDPAAAGLVTTVDTLGSAMDVAVDGTHVFVADGLRGLAVIDVSDAESAHVVGLLRTPRHTRSVAASGGLVFLGERDDLEYGVWILDATDPTAPRSLAFADVPGGGDRVALRGNVVYVSVVLPGTSPFNPWAGAKLSIAAVDVTDPAHPVVVVPSSPGAPAVRVATGPAQAGELAGLLANDLTVAGDLVYLVGGNLGTGRTPGLSQPNDPKTSGNQVLTVYSVTSNPMKPTQTGIYVTPGQALGVTGTDRHAYVADGTNGVVVADCQARPPDRVGGFDEGVVGYPVALDVLRDVLAIADKSMGLRLADISVPDQPDLVGAFETGSWPVDVDLYRDHAYVARELTYTYVGRQATYIGGLEIVHVADPARPARGSVAIEDTNLSGVQVFGDRAFVTSWKGVGSLTRERGLHVVDVSVPLKPEPKIVFDAILEPSDISISGYVAYITESNTGVWAVNVQVPEQPVKEGFVGTHGPANAVAGAHGYAYVADGAAGLMVADMRDPDAPDRISTIGVDGEALDVAVTGSFVAVAAGKGGVRLIDVSDPASPAEADQWSGRGTAISVAVRGDIVYAGLAEGSVQVFRIEERELPTPTPTATSTATPTEVPTATESVTPLPDVFTIWLPVAAAQN